MPSSNFLAVAFTDVNGNGQYNPVKDILIAALVDTNKDNVVSAGDTIIWGTYPAGLDGSESGTGGQYTSLDTTVTSVDFVGPYDLSVETALGLIVWGVSTTEYFETYNNSFGLESELVDVITNVTFVDMIYADPTVLGPGLPDTSVDVFAVQPGDQAFLDVYNGWWT